MDWQQKQGIVTDARLEDGISEELKTIGIFKGLKADCVVAARKKWKGDEESFLNHLIFGCAGLRAGTKKLVMEDYAIAFREVSG